VEYMHLGEVGPESTLRYHCERLPYVACLWAHVCCVGEVYTHAGWFMNPDLHDTLGYE
jgi:hypothetical protein